MCYCHLPIDGDAQSKSLTSKLLLQHTLQCNNMAINSRKGLYKTLWLTISIHNVKLFSFFFSSNVERFRISLSDNRESILVSGNKVHHATTTVFLRSQLQFTQIAIGNTRKIAVNVRAVSGMCSALKRNAIKHH